MLKKVQSHSEAVAWAATSGCEEAVEMSHRALIRSKLMDWATAQGRAAEWKEVNELLETFLDEQWAGGLQTVANERINQKLRDLDGRKTLSKCSARATRWETAARCGVLEQWGRKLVKPPHSEVPIRVEDADIKCLFKPEAVLDTNLDLKRVLQDNCFQSWTGQTLRRACSEQELMDIAYKARDKTMISKRWMTGLLPVRQVVGVGEGASLQTFFVLNSDGGAAQVWPVQGRAKHCTIALDREIHWISLTSIFNVTVLPTVASSPLRALVMEKAGKSVPPGISLRAIGAAVPLLEWHQDRGFAGIREATLQKLKDELKAKDLPAETVGIASTEDMLVAALFLQHQPHASPADVAAKLSRRQALNMELEDPEEISQELLDENLSAKAREEVQTRRKEVAKAKSNRQQWKHSTARFVETLKPFLKNKKQKTGKSDVQKSVGRLSKDRGATWNNFANPGDGLRLICSLKPVQTAVVQDDYHGYFRLTHVELPGSLKHISWTRRGTKSAVARVLGQLWAWDNMLTGAACPLPAQWMEGDVDV